jgi:hypothetical protein
MRKEMMRNESLTTRVDRMEKEFAEKLKDHQGKIQLIFEALRQLVRPDPPERRKIGFRKD